jgi:outer membrane protein OmpA-like peptidoglycan-associated protein
MITASRVAVIASLSAIIGLSSGQALAQDVPDSQDHPLVSRYAGSSIVWYDFRDFDEYTLLMGPFSEDQPSQTVEGEVTRISYNLPADRSTLEVMRNYEQQLEAAGFETLFSCSNPDCGGLMFNRTAVEYVSGFGGNFDDHRYLAAHRSRDDGDVHVSLYVVRNTSEGGSRHDQIFYRLTVVEGEPMDVGMVTVDAETMALEIAETGSVSIYGIYFDTDRADVKPESDSTLEEISKLLGASAGLQLYVVGHTDNTGQLDYNMDLSRRRADAVVEALVGRFGVDASRLTPRGVGPLAPVSTNESDAGRGLNRRVELVSR